MLPTTNHTITIQRLVSSGEKRVFTEVQTVVRVYINQTDESLATGFENMGAFFLHRMMTSGLHEMISIGDRIVDEYGKQYEIRSLSKSVSIVGMHHQYLMTEAYE